MGARSGSGDFVRADGPNILMVMSDQHRADWLGCAGAGWVKTPNIDAIAARGIRFSRAACNSPVCAPSRAALASGLRCSTVGVLGNNDLYPLNVPTYYQVLRQAGYRVGCVGKTDLHKRDHWEGRNGDRPIMYHLGFTDPMETEGKCSAGRYCLDAVCPYTAYLVEQRLAETFYQDYQKRGYLPGYDSVLPLHAYHDDFVGRNACSFLEAVPDETPWHYFVSFVGPHDPWDAPKEYSSLYDPADMPASLAIHDHWSDRPANTATKSHAYDALLTEETLSEAMRQYAGMVTLIDDYVGRFVSIVEERGQLDNTVVIYTSDHGEMMGDHGLFGKTTYYEGSLRVPLIIAGPGIKRGGASECLVHLADAAPTILELAGLKSPFPMESSSLLPIIGDEGEEPEYQLSELRSSRMLYDGRHKYIERDDGPDELYDLEEDPREIKNLVTQEPRRTGTMKARLHRLLRS